MFIKEPVEHSTEFKYLKFSTLRGMSVYAIIILRINNAVVIPGKIFWI